MTRLDDLTDLLEARGDAADGIHPNLGDVRSRARRQRHSTVLVGAVASVAAVGGVAAAVLGAVGGDGAGQRVGTSGAVSRPAPRPVSEPIPDYQRTLLDGHVIRIRSYGSHAYFGPFGDSHRWTAPADCPTGIAIDLALPGTGAIGTRGGSGGLFETQRSVATQLTWQADAPGSGTQAIVALVPDARPGVTYRLVVDGKPVDTATATSTAVALAGQGAAHVRQDRRQSVDVRLQQLGADGSVVSDEPLPTAHAYDPPACEVPPRPSGLAAASAADSQDPDDVAIRAVITALMPTNGNTSAAFSHVDDPDGTLAALGGNAVPNNMATVAREIHRDSPTHAWVRYGYQLGGGNVTAETPDVFVGWVEMNRIDGRWLMTKESYCAFASGPAVGGKCPGTPTYAPISASDSPGVYVYGG